MGIWATARSWLALLFGPTFRDRRDRLADEARQRAIREGRIYEPPDRAAREVLGEHPHYWINISTKGPDGRLLVEPVKMAWPLALSDVDRVPAQARIATEVIAAYKRLRERRAKAWTVRRGS